MGHKVKRKKYKIALSQLEFLGYLIDDSGLHPKNDKVREIQEVPTSRIQTELQAFLGLLNFYSVFLLQKATVA